MPEISQYLLTNKELLELIIKQADIHEGRWTLMANFGVGAGNYGPSPDQIAPGALITINQIGIQRSSPNTPVATSVDAAVANPSPQAAKASRSRRKKKS